MANKTQRILIESILGGQGPSTHFAKQDQYLSSLGIDPKLPIGDFNSSGVFTGTLGVLPSGLLRPAPARAITSTGIHMPYWMSAPRGTTIVYMYDNVGSAWAISQDGGNGSVTALADGGTLSSSGGNGMAYYDNYIYFAKNTDIARFGPLDGAATFTGTYWTGTLGLSALSNINYPVLKTSVNGSYQALPQHQMLRHSDGKLYIADTVNNQGTLHYLQTTKTTVEGDTSAGSQYSAITLGYGLVPTALESYGQNIAIAVTERAGDHVALLNESGRGNTTRAKIAFWDTTSRNINQITWVEFPDGIISAMKNLNGTLYIFSTPHEGSKGFRVTRYIGGYSFEEVYVSGVGTCPFPGAVDGIGGRLIFGSETVLPETNGCVFALDVSGTSGISGLHNIAATTNTDVCVTALAIPGGINMTDSSLSFDNPVFGWSDGGSTHGITYMSAVNTAYGNAPSSWWSQMFRIGQPFKITKIRIPLAQSVSSNMIVTPKIYTDDSSGTTYTLSTINNTNYPGKRNIVIRPENVTGSHNFWLELRWTGSALCTVGLPITIEYELIDD